MRLKKKRKMQFKATQLSNTDIIDKDSPFSFIEGYRSLRTNLSFTTFSGEIKSILVSSSLPGEGKSSISINLARTIAMSGKKVLLIDGDLRSPSIHKYLRVSKKINQGFSSVLAGKTDALDAIYYFPPLEIDVMLSGPIPPNASELLSREHTGEIMKQLHNKYDTVIIDTPAGVVTDAVVLSNYTDGLLFVVKQNYADRDIIKSSLKSFESSNTKVLGVVLNDYQSSKNTHGYNYEYQYNYGSE